MDRGRALGPGFLGRLCTARRRCIELSLCGCGLGVMHAAAVAVRAIALEEGVAHLYVPQLAGGSFGAVALQEGLAHLGLGTDFDMGVRARVVAAHPSKEVEADRHLLFAHAVHERAVVTKALALEELPADGDLVRIVEVRTPLFVAFAELGVEQAVLFALVLLLLDGLLATDLLETCFDFSAGNGSDDRVGLLRKRVAVTGLDVGQRANGHLAGRERLIGRQAGLLRSFFRGDANQRLAVICGFVTNAVDDETFDCTCHPTLAGGPFAALPTCFQKALPPVR
mmetsp:Transcript_22429/g.38498  ORF Transcript_22429/g.38498 Transcript_22429/m.38498 type:complete len:282 (+) Transcript_22429:217-1062(+)